MRRLVGACLAPAVFVALLVMPLSGLSPEAHRLAPVMAAVATLCGYLYYRFRRAGWF